nr:hypothetical protein [Deltaproteobacteria bacterium]
RYLLVEADSFARQRRLKDPLYAAVCPLDTWLPVACADDLERIVLAHPVVETVDDVYLVDLAHRIDD